MISRYHLARQYATSFPGSFLYFLEVEKGPWERGWAVCGFSPFWLTVFGKKRFGAKCRVRSAECGVWKIPVRASRGLKWENKMYKLQRSIVVDSHVLLSPH